MVLKNISDISLHSHVTPFIYIVYNYNKMTISGSKG